MHLIFVFVGIALILLGAAIGQFRLAHLLANVDMDQVDPARKGALARYAGSFVAVIGVVFLMLGYLVMKASSERDVVVLMACLIPVMMVISVTYMVGLGRFMKK